MQGKHLHGKSFRVFIAGCQVCCLMMVLWIPLMANASQGSRVAAADETRILRDAQSAFNVKNFLMAKQLAEKIRDVAGGTGEDARHLIKLVDDITINNKKREQAFIAITRGNPTQACSLLSEIQTAVDANKELAVTILI